VNIIIRFSPDHFSEIARIDSKHGRIFIEAKKAFEAAHAGVSADTHPDWLKALEELEEDRQQDLANMRMWLADGYARQ
jgi:hypothetical protein